MVQRVLLKLFTKSSISKQFRNLFVFLVMVPLLLIDAVASAYSARQMAASYEHLSVSKASQVRTILATTSATINEIYAGLNGDATLQELFSGGGTSGDFHSRLYLYDGFQEMFKKSTVLNDIRLYLSEDLLQSDTPLSGFYPITEEVKGEVWYDIAANSQAAFWKSEKVEIRGVTYHVLNYYAKIPFPERQTSGILVITVSNDYLRNLIRDPDYTICINVNDGPVFFSSDASYLEQSFPAAVDDTYYFEESGPMKIGEDTQIASIQTMRPTASNDRIHILVFDPGGFQRVRLTTLLFSLATFAVIFVVALLFFLYSRFFGARIRTLRLAMHKAANSDYEIIDSMQGDDELTETFRDLKETVNTLKANQEALYEGRLKEQRLINQQQETELMLLASQINPHFLYNTLEMLRMKALMDGSPEVANAIKLLGKNMRYVLGTTRTTATTLDKELDYVSSYLAIMKLRFDERLTWRIDVDAALDPARYQILPLLIQPLIENAIIHGIEESGEAGEVTVTLVPVGAGDLAITVADTGAGMSPGKVEELRGILSGPHPETRHGVGLYNVNHRIRLYYGEEYGLEIESEEGNGTRMMVTVPLREAGEV